MFSAHGYDGGRQRPSRPNFLVLDSARAGGFRGAPDYGDPEQPEKALTADQPTSGEKLEKVAFQFCKIATVALICGRFTLPIAATLASGLYLSAQLKGKHDTRCILRYPILISAFWGIIAVIAWVFILNPGVPEHWLRSLGLFK
jgi:hypothetical protein